MDAAGSVNVADYLKRPEEDRTYGYGSVCVPGLAAGLWMAHQKWGVKKWADDVQPAITLARDGFRVLPQTREFFAEQEKKLRRGDAEIARLYLPDGQLAGAGNVARECGPRADAGPCWRSTAATAFIADPWRRRL